MKIAIKGHKSRGKEVIQILESLGGINRCPLEGESMTSYYYVDCDEDNVIRCHDRRYVNKHCKKYTLEEFEEEFPFKVGDRVISTRTNFIGTITKLSENGWYYVKYDNGNFACVFGQNLKSYKEMERNITLTLEKAKEWYKKGGELKEIALQAFTEKELNPLPRSWEEFCKNYPKIKGEAFVDTLSVIFDTDIDGNIRDIYKDRNFCPSKKSAEAHLAMIQLEQLRNCWWNGWEPEYNCGTKYIIKWDKDDLIVATSGRIRAFLIFPTRETAEEFLKCFRDLIEQAGDLI